MHGHTYMGHPLACAAALAVQRTVREQNLLANVRTQGARLKSRLTLRLRITPTLAISEAAGCSAASNWSPIAPPRRLSIRRCVCTCESKAKRCNADCSSTRWAGTVDGRSGDHVLIAPPYIIDESHVDEIVDKVATAIDAALATATPLPA